MTKYYWEWIPTPYGKMPRDPNLDYCLGDRYDRMPWMNEAEAKYDKEIEIWRKHQLMIIRWLSTIDLRQWKKEYKEIETGNYKKQGKDIRPRHPDKALVTLDEEVEIGDIASLAKNNIKNKTMYYSEDIYIGDSGASCHMVHSDKGMYDATTIKEKITIGNGQSIEALKIGKKRGMIKNDDGTIMNVVLTNVKYVPDLAPYNLFSITQAISSGWMLGNEGKTIILKNGQSVLKFNKMLKTKSGYVGGAEILPRVDDNIAAPALSPGKGVDIMKFHDMLGHVSESMTRKTAEYYGVKLIGNFDVCVDCAKAKARQKNVPKGNDTVHATSNGERLFMDISSIKTISYGGAKFWLLVVDDRTDYSWSYFLKRKSETKDKICELVLELKSKNGYNVLFIRCDKAGENKTAQQELKRIAPSIKFEYTAPDTPQQNGRVERKFATLYGRVRAMLNRGQLPNKIRHKLWAEAANMANHAENMSLKPTKESPSYKQFYKVDAKEIWSLRRFGEIGIAKKGPDIQSKIANPGIAVMYLGHASEHGQEVYRLLNLDTKRVVMSRDVRWLDQNYTNYRKSQGLWDPNDEDDPDDVSDEEYEENVVEDAIYKPTRMTTETNNDTTPTQTVTWSDMARRPATRSATRAGVVTLESTGQTQRPNAKLIRQLASLSGTGIYKNPEAEKVLDEAEQQAQGLNEQLVRASVVEELEDAQSGRDKASIVMDETMDQLFGDFALFVRETMMKEQDIEMEDTPPMDDNEEKLLKEVNNSKQHLIDLLDETIQNDKKLKESDRLIKLKHIISKLKEDIPENFQQAYNHPDEKIRAKWREGIKKEFHDMIKRGVWRNVNRKDVPSGRRCIKNRWVFEIKRNGIFRSRLVACGYSQIPGVDFTESYAPVINDVTWRMLIIAKMVWNLQAKIVDVETAFLHGDLDEEIYMEAPEGLGLDKDKECVLLKKSIYGLVQAARMYFLKFMKVLRIIGFVGGNADPCMMVRRNNNGICFIAIWVDDSLLIGHEATILQTIEDLKAHGFGLKIEGELDDYLSCEITFAKDNKMGWIHQPHLIKKIEKKFGPMVKGLQVYKTPGTPGGSILRNPVTKVDAQQQKIYRSGVGMLLYLVKHSRPDIANAVRELSKALDGTSAASYKELMRVLKYVIDTKRLSLKMKPIYDENETAWTLVAFSDSDYAGDSETRVSIAGFILYLMGVPISWKSKGQKGVTLSSSEAEFVALSEAAKEIKFVFQVLQSMGVKVTLPIVVRVDNVGAIFIGTNVTVSQRSKHIDVRYHFVREYIQDGFLRIIFVRTKDNDADIFTKNLSGDLHHRHASKMVGEKQDGTG